MNFQSPEALYFILPLIFAVLVLALYARANRRRAAQAFADAAMSPRVLPPESASRFWCKLALWEAALIFTLLAIARPQWGEIVEEVKIKGSDLYIMIDVSRSMLATDVPPSRLERAKADVSGLLSRLKGERVGLIAFAGRAAILSPLTADYAFFRARLAELGPNSVDRGGTAIGDAIRKALSVLPEAPDRDQALLLITDGDDQDSDPLHAAAVAAERHIAIFTVGLGDPNEGARVPDKEGKGRFMTYEGKDVISKMDDELLGKIALQTGGTYVPARTKAYDLGKLYEEKLSQLRGEYAKEQKRTRQAERFEIPLALALICFTLELLIRPYRQKTEAAQQESRMRKPKGAKPLAAALAVMLACAGFGAFASDARDLVNEGLKLYSKQDFDGAGEKFSEAEKAAPQQDVLEAAERAAFDAGCAYARKGDVEKATDAYKKAALARDRMLAASAHFNLGEISANAAKDLAGAQPEAVPPDKRKEIVDKLLEAVGHYRNCLEIQPEYASARKNIELIRQWIKLYANVWAQLDRKKRRDEMNLLQFLEFLAHDERQLRAGSLALNEYASADDYAELKRVQDELTEEIEPLKEKIEKDTISNSQLVGGPAPAPNSDEEKKKAEAVKKLKELADGAGEKMRAASGSLNANRADEAAALQKEAAATFDTIWESLAPFQAALARDMKDETQIVDALKESDSASEPAKNDSAKKDDAAKKDDSANKNETAKKPDDQTKESSPISAAELAELQTDTARRTMLMKFRAATELAEMGKNAPKTDEKSKEKEWLTLDDVKREEAKKKAEEEKKKREEEKKKHDEELKKNGQQPDGKKDEKDDDKPPTPEEIRKGLEKAIELAPKAVEKMNSAAEHFKKEERAGALPDTEEAKKILQEIMDAQPKQKKKDQKQDDKKDQQNQQNQEKSEQQKKEEEKKKQEQQKKDEEKKKEEEKKKQEQEKKKDEQKDQKKDEQNKDKQEKQEQGAAKPQPMTKEQAEAMLRKVRERELDHRKKKQDEQDAILGRLRGVEKDW